MPTRPPIHVPLGHETIAQRRKRRDREQGSPTQRGYGADWKRLRLAHLKANPLCVFCRDAGVVKAADVVDHIKSVVDHPDLRLEPSNLRSLCESHHNARTAREQGFAAPGRRPT
jgi:5-methylcytosine-specific restriction protein A